MKVRIDARRVTLGRQTALEWARVRRPGPAGIIFVPPLIGGTFSQQVKTFRRLVRIGYDLVTFNYSGHGASTDKFCLKASLRDTQHVLGHACRAAARENLPLYGLASCYAAIPILYGAHHRAEPFRRLILINAIPRLSLQAAAKSFLDYYRDIHASRIGMRALKGAARQYLDLLFPEVIKDTRQFGSLKRRRTRLLKTLAQALTLDPLKGVCLPRTPVLCLYARNDHVLESLDHAAGHRYEEEIRRICPQAWFQPLEADHYLSLTSARGEALQSILRFLGRQ